MIEPGQILGGKYRVERILGKGGMGCVVQALHLALGTRVAVKFLLPDALDNQLAVERFLREARAAVRLRSEHVCRVHDVGTFEDGTPFMVMEFLDGSDLAAVVARQGPLPVATAVDHVLQACEAVAEAHASGVIHRDLKPANLFLTRRADGSPLIKVLDFGISKVTAGESDEIDLTQTATVIGSPGYMSPEQLRSSRDVDVRTDVWSLGVILYQLVEGQPPFRATSITEVALRIGMDPTPPFTVTVPDGFPAVVFRALEKEPAARYRTVADFAAAIAPFGGSEARQEAVRISRVMRAQSGEPAEARQSVSSDGTPRTTISEATGQSVQASRGRRRGGVWLALVMLAFAIGAAATLFLIERAKTETATEPNAPATRPPATGRVSPPAPTPTGAEPSAQPAPPLPEPAPAPAPADEPAPSESEPAAAPVAKDKAVPPGVPTPPATKTGARPDIIHHDKLDKARERDRDRRRKLLEIKKRRRAPADDFSKSRI